MAFLLIAFAIAVAGVLWLPPIAQDPTYHDFADRRGLLGIPNFLDITTNLAFLAVGIAGIILCARDEKPGARRAWMACFTGVTLVCFGSGYYHFAPDNGTLVWDRLPMSIGFMALSVAVVAECVNPRLERILLAPAILLGIASVIYWHYTDDLRLYVLVQFLPLLMIPAVLLLFGGARKDRGYLLTALAVYMVSKLAEYYDRAVFEWTGAIISGHSLKHLLAALALFIVYTMLRRRTLRIRPA
ncbi:MAG: ceramidase domain-containing protein [Gammaproteobacteria bacterium]|nr:ceramidase domain-containing protein [Gammaproteobacteria bacterium]